MRIFTEYMNRVDSLKFCMSFNLLDSYIFAINEFIYSFLNWIDQYSLLCYRAVRSLQFHHQDDFCQRDTTIAGTENENHSRKGSKLKLNSIN